MGKMTVTDSWVKEHQWHISHTGKSGVADQSINLSHYIQLHNTITLSFKFQYVDSTIGQQYRTSSNPTAQQGDNLLFSRSWKPLNYYFTGTKSPSRISFPTRPARINIHRHFCARITVFLRTPFQSPFLYSYFSYLFYF